MSTSFRGIDPRTGELLDPEYRDSTPEEIEAAAEAAGRAFESYADLPGEKRAALLRAIGDKLVHLGDALLGRAERETGLTRARLESERGRTVNQLRMFADLIEDGSWVDARIDRADLQRVPPRPDLRRMLRPVGPVAVFGSSNFPLAFSVAGGDTASALAAGCPVVVKAHPAHPGTSDLAAGAILAATEALELPEGVFGIVHGSTPEVGLSLVRQRAIEAVAFTGSTLAGRALFDAAAARARPIPVFAEMGSSNPVVFLEGALAERGAALAQSFAASIALATGQFCTCPGLLLVPRSAAGDAFLDALAQALGTTAPGVAVHAGIARAYRRERAEREQSPGVRDRGAAAATPEAPEAQACASLLECDAPTFLATPRLAEELYGPAALAVRYSDAEELLTVVRALPGQLTATLQANPDELEARPELIQALARKAGRLVFGGVPTGVEVSSAMHHGGPWPAATDARFTSVGTAAILRFARPVCYQNAPVSALPPELHDGNPKGLWRLVDGRLTREAVVS